MYLLHLPFPSLISLLVKFDHPHRFRDSLRSFSEFSTNLRNVCLYMGLPDNPDVAFDEMFSSCICRWRNLQTVRCPYIALDMDALAHLSRMPALTQLTFTPIVALSDCVSPLFFSKLCDLTLHSASWAPILHLLSRIQLPAIEDFTAFIGAQLSRQELSSFLDGVRTSNANHTIKCLSLYQTSFTSSIFRSETPLLSLADLRLCMAFRDLCHINLDIEWNVGLTDSDLLALASAWPNLEHFAINEDWGWNTPDGITPNGLLQLLQTCPSLCQVHLAMDTRGYTDLPPVDLGLKLPLHFYLYVLDSVIEVESVPAVAAFFTGIASCSDFSFDAWSGIDFMKPRNWTSYDARWDDVGRLVQDAIRRRS